MKKLLALLTLPVLASCASVMTGFSGDHHEVKFESNTNATYTVYRGDGSRVYTGLTPGLLNLETSEGYFDRANYTVHFKKPGQPEHVVGLNATIRPWYIGNLLLGGVLGGLVVDPLTGAMWTLPDKVSTNFDK